MQKKLLISVRDFAVPVPRVGSIEAHSGYGPLPQQGADIHREIQATRSATDPLYVPEFALSYVCATGDLDVRIAGRVDGFYAAATPIFEEIKTAFDAPQLQRRLQEQPSHPYWLQLLTYAYIHYKTTGVMPACRLLIVSARTREEAELNVALDLDAYEAWLARRLLELQAEELQLAKRSKRRKQVGRALAFPYATQRPGQGELMQRIAEAPAKTKHLLIEAPTGMGKTLAILLPTLREAMLKGAPLLYVTPKNSQHAAPEHAAKQLGKVRTITLTAKARICMKSETICNPDYCEFARDHYQKVAAYDLVAKVGARRTVTSHTLQDLARRYEVCPAELGLEAAAAFDLIIGDYNYVIQPMGLVGRVTAKLRGKAAKPSLVVDEAHNLYTRATENRSAILSRRELQRLAEPALAVPQLRGLVADTCALIQRQGPSTRPMIVDDRLQEELIALERRWSALMAQYLASDAVIGEHDPVLHLTAYWRNFSQVCEQIWLPTALPPEAIDPGVFSCLYERSPADEALRVICCDASAFLAESFLPFGRVVAFSATLRPFAFYARLSGLNLEALETAAYASPFPAAHRKVLVIPQVSTKLRDRRHNAAKIAGAIVRLTQVRAGNYMAFFPSFQFLNEVAAHLPSLEAELVVQTPGMSRAQTSQVLDRLRSQQQPMLVLGVQGGSFAEGIDYPGEQLIGVLIVGPALPTCDVAREILRSYYEKTYGQGQGYDYAYTYPAMAKVVQAAGRVIRTDTDKGLIVLMDARFTEPRYSALLPPDWFEHSVQELVSTAILGEVAGFWQQVLPAPQPDSSGPE